MTDLPERQVLYSLAAEIGYTVAELSEKMTVDEFSGWIAYRELVDERIKREQNKGRKRGGR